MRIGSGYDLHRFVAGRPLILGGIVIPYEKGLDGHSDADVLTHAICDALLGAAGLGDIGCHFPDTDPAYKDIDSQRLLADTKRQLNRAGYDIVNLDATLMAQKPKLAPYRKAMIERLATTLEVTSHKINIKATTTEGLGAIGRREGIAAMCTALIQKCPPAS